MLRKQTLRDYEMKSRKVELLLAVLLVMAISIYVLPVNALPATGSWSATDPTDDVFTDYCDDDGYFPMRDITALNMTWDETTLTITLEVATLTNTTAAWNNTGFTITIGNGTGGNNWWPQWSSTNFNQTTAAIANWTYAILVQNVTAEGGLAYSYVCNVTWNYIPFTDLGITVEIPTSPANTIIVRVPWEAIGGFDSYGDVFYACAASFYCYGYGVGVPPVVISKFLDHIGFDNEKIVIVHEDWGFDPDGYPKYEVIIGDYNIIPEFPILWLLFAVFLAITTLTLATKKIYKH